ncbi:MAG: phosphonate metabolism protein/1,5-bisphosphokinase (PRPP-forming) PhnN [Pseudomonadota bacterium]
MTWRVRRSFARCAAKDNELPKLGTFFAVVGPSGAGKDTLIDAAEKSLGEDKRFVFARRYITRPEDSGGEAHRAISREAFERKAKGGEFALSWSAHGLYYGVPVAVVEATSSGSNVVCNLSRSVVQEASRMFSNLAVLHITAPPEVLAQRLAERNREAAHDIDQRLNRCVPQFGAPNRVVEFENVGPVEETANQFIRTLLKISTQHA